MSSRFFISFEPPLVIFKEEIIKKNFLNQLIRFNLLGYYRYTYFFCYRLDEIVMVWVSWTLLLKTTFYFIRHKQIIKLKLLKITMNGNRFNTTALNHFTKLNRFFNRWQATYFTCNWLGTSIH